MLKDVFRALRSAERPILVVGAGARLAGAGAAARELAAWLGVPVATTWAARDMFPANDTRVLCVGGFGTHGTRAANFAVQNADWILSVGSRLDSKATGTPRAYFARAARVFMVDIDPAEIAKFKGELGKQFTGAQADAKMFLDDAIRLVRREGGWPDFAAWRAQCFSWLGRYPAVLPEYEREPGINPYLLVRVLSEYCAPGEVIVSDTGLSLGWMMQAFMFKAEQRFIHAWNQTPMGYGLPAAVGAAFARPGQRVILVTGDGGFMLNAQELALLAYHKLPVKIILFNNGGHAMCRQTQEQWLGGKYYSTSPAYGLAFPDFVVLAASARVRSWGLAAAADTDGVLRAALAAPGPAFVEVMVDPGHRLVPQVQYGKPNEDGNPPLPRDELAANMIVGMVEGGDA